MATGKGLETKRLVAREALRVINEHGIRATSVNDLVERTGVKKGNLYFHYESKEAIGRAALEEARAQSAGYQRAAVKGQTPLEKLFDIVEAVYRFHEERGFVGGCVFGNTALETADDGSGYGPLVRDIFDEWAGMFRHLLEKARDRGDLPPGIDPLPMSRHIVAVLEGGIMLCRLNKKGDDLASGIAYLKKLLGVVA